MNHIYRSIRNEVTGAVVTVSEHAKRSGKKISGAKNAAVNSLAVSIALLSGSASHAAPTGGTVVAGNASITNTANTTTINQSSQNAVLNWQSFDIGVGEAVNFVQPNSSSVALNRVLGADPSSILGNLSANGKVFLINPNGILFGTSAQVNVGGLVASTRDIADSDFMAGQYSFSGASNGAILNQGSINADGGYVALLGANVSNEGVIAAKLGSVALAAGEAITLDVAGDGLLNVTVNAGAVDALVQNGGLIQADGGQVLLTAKSASSLLQSAVNNTGLIQAQTIENHNGVIKLLGDMQSGTVNAGGTLDASAPNSGNGGFIETSAAHVQIASDTSVTTAASEGTTGQWLIDPVDFTIAATGGDITGALLSTNLGSSNVIIQSSSGASGVNGDINVNDTVTWSANKLTLNAQNNININTAMYGSGTASLALLYGQAAVAAGNTSTVNILAPVNLPSGNNLSMTSGSDGSTVNYTVINNMTALQNINSNLNGNYALGSNLDATGVNGFTRIGQITSYNDFANCYNGQFDGLGHTINHLTINQPSTNYVGLFGSISSSSSIKNLGLLNVNVTGLYETGSLVGFHFGAVSNSYATGTVTGLGDVGGLIGYSSVGSISNSYSSATVTTGPNYDSVGGGLIGYNYVGTINNSYATGSVTAALVGGLAGVNNGGTINNSYSTGLVSLNQYGHNPGGLVGVVYNGAVANNSYWNLTTSGQTNSSGGTGLTTSQLQAALPSGFSASIWSNAGNQTTPYLLNNPGPVLIATDTSTTYYNIIQSLYQLQNIYANLSGKYALGNDIEASATSSWNSGSGFLPLGDNSTKFTGTFDGLSHVINNLTINRPTTDYVGLFGYAQGSTVNRLGLANANITGQDYVGALFGTTVVGTATRDYATGQVTGRSSVGGLIGYNNSMSTSADYATANVSGVNKVGGLMGETNGGVVSTLNYASGNVTASGSYVGGLVGYNGFGFLITNSYATGNVVGVGAVGGLVGYHLNGNITQSYSTGSVAGSSDVGGLIGFTDTGTVSNSYWNSTTSGQASSAGGTALTSAQMQQQANFVGFDFSTTWIGYDGYTNPLLRTYMTALTVTANNATKTYNGQAYNGSAGVSYSVTPNMSNLLGTLSLTGGTNAGTSAITASGLYSNQQGYIINYVNGTLTVDKAILTATANASSKVYDGNTTASATLTGFTGLIGTETINATASATFNSKDVASANLVTVNSVVLSNGTNGGLASNYSLASGQTAAANINTKALTATVAAPSKTYDGNATASATMNGLTGFIGTETVTATGTATFNSKDVATANLVTVNSTTLIDGSNGGLASNYSLASGQTAAANITAKSLTATVSAPNKVYDGTATANATLSGLTGFIGSETVNASGMATFNSKDVASANLVTVNSTVLTDGSNGGLASNYSLASGQTVAASITAKSLTAIASATDKVYDGNTSANATLSLTGLVGSETVNASGTATFNSKDVATANLVTVNSTTLSDGSNGGLASNYSLVSGQTVAANITAKALTATLVAPDKVYDGNTTASATLSNLTGLVGSETVSASGAATFNSKDVATANLVTVNSVTLADGNSGGLASNYSLASGQTVAANITAKSLTATVSAPSKVYDGNTSASATLSNLSGLVGSETVSASGAATFNSKDVATANLVTVNSVTLSNGSNGGLASNYSLASGQTVAASITPKALTVVGQVAMDKVYDGTTTAMLAGGSLSGVIAGEAVALDTAGTFATASVGNDIAVTATNSISGSAAVNYTLTQPTGLMADIAAPATYQNAVTHASSVMPVVPSTPLPLVVPLSSATGLVSYDLAGLNLTVITPDTSLLPSVRPQDSRDDQE